MAHQPSSVDRLPEEVREEIGRLRVQGRTIDEIMAHLRQLDVEISRSALGRHVKGMAAMKERLQRSRDMALALVDRFGTEPDNRVARLNLELMHSVVMQTITATEVDEDGELQPVTFDPENAMFLARALKELSSAEKTNTDRALAVQRETAKTAANKAEEAMKSRGMSRETIRLHSRRGAGGGVADGRLQLQAVVRRADPGGREAADDP